MKVEKFDFSNVDHRVALLAIHVRNAMESFHCEVDGLTDEVMREMNKAIRRSLYECLTNADSSSLEWAILMIPDYWEPASEIEVLV